MTTKEFTMSQKELDRVAIIQQVFSKQLTQREAALQLELSTRQVRNLQREFERAGVQGLLSKRRGQPSNHRLQESVKQKALELIQSYYGDFGPTLAHEKLTEQHQLRLSVESVRQLMLQAGLWKAKQRRCARIHPSRARRTKRGELVQMDGSPHDWFEGRRPPCCLIVLIDDATSELLVLQFVEQEGTEGYFSSIEQHLHQHGRPLAYYSDRHSIFRVNTKEAQGGSGETQLGRALRELDIQLICAHSPQAKGRVEKANRTLQDRLVKELRLKGLSDIPTANAFLPTFIADYNRRFAVVASHPVDAHRPIQQEEAALKRIFSQQCQRIVSKNLEVSYQNVLYQIQTKTPAYTMRGARITLCDRAGEVTLWYKGRSLPYTTLDKQNRPAPVQSRKEVQQLTPHKPHKPTAKHPWRTYENTAQLKERNAEATI